jgi:uroporphyrinogen III methyltransferase / synthase
MPDRSEQPLLGARVMVTRPHGDNDPLRKALAAMGAEVLDLPVISVAPPEDGAPLRAALAALDRFDWIAFTSRNSVRAVLDALGATQLTIPAAMRVAAVGPATCTALEAASIDVECMPPEASAADLAAAMAATGIAGQRVLLPVGDRARHDLRNGLAAAGAVVEQVIAYRTVSTGERGEALRALTSGSVDIVALASPSAVTALVALLGGDPVPLRYTRLACIGPTTASAVTRLGLVPAAVATEHTALGLADAIARLYQTMSK